MEWIGEEDESEKRRVDMCFDSIGTQPPLLREIAPPIEWCS